MSDVFFFSPNIGFGGVTEVTKKLSCGISKRGKNVTILTNRISKKYRDIDFDSKVKILEISTYRDLFFVARLVKNKKIIFTPSYHSIIFSLMFSIISQSSCYFILDRKLSSYKAGGIYSRLYFYASHILTIIADGYICTYESAYKELINNKVFKKKRIKLIYYPVSSEFFTVEKVRCKSYDLIYAGRLEPEKGVDVLLNSVLSLREKHNKKLRVCILGDGSLRDHLEDFCFKNNLDDVYFIGVVKNVSQYMAESKLFVLPSRSEGCGSVLKESLVVGIPAVVTNVDTHGPQDAIGNGEFGEISKVGCYEDLSEKILHALDAKYSPEFRESIIHRLTIPFASKEYLEFIEE